MTLRGGLRWWVLFCGVVMVSPLPAEAPPWAVPEAVGSAASAERLILVPRPGVERARRDALHRAQRLRLHRRFDRLGGIEVVAPRPGQSRAALLARLRASGLYEVVEPDYEIRIATVPDDPRYADGSLWHLHNTGQSGGMEDADLDAPEGWAHNLGAPGVVVAIVDSGVRYTHEDLAANMWINPGEIPGNGLDDDGNGYIDDVHGISAIDGSGDPSDNSGHGTHVAGIVAAVGNNGVGVTGVAWRAQIMALSFLDADGTGSTSGAIECIDYAIAHGAQVINASWSASSSSGSLLRALRKTDAAGIVFVAAAGNEGADLGVSPEYPAAYRYLANKITVAATTRQDALASYSNFGDTEVSVAAPGSDIRSTWFTNDSAYVKANGTSMAAPVVTGIVAHLIQLMPEASPGTIVGLVESSVDPLPALASKTATGGRVNLSRALLATGYFEPLPFLPVFNADVATGGFFQTSEAVPGATYVIEESPDRSTWTEVATVTADAEGQLAWSFDGAAPMVFIRLRPVFDLPE